MILRTVAKMQNDVGMTSQVVYCRYISLFGNYFTKIRYKFDEKTSHQINNVFDEKSSHQIYNVFDEKTSFSKKMV